MIERKKVLVIDDDSTVLDFLVAKLGASCEVISTASPREALRLAREHKPDLILCDIDMPEVDGGDISRQLFDDEAIRAIPFVYLTAIASPKDLGPRGGYLGGRMAISKHQPADELLGRVRELLGN
jgi:two-component system cell cycle response regulator DivK